MKKKGEKIIARVASSILWKALGKIMEYIIRSSDNIKVENTSRMRIIVDEQIIQ